MSPATRRASRVAVLVAAAGFVGLVISNSFEVGAFDCTVCMTFKGRQSCRTVQGPTEAEAGASAVNNACALIASGVTDSMACERTPPDSIECVASK